MNKRHPKASIHVDPSVHRKDGTVEEVCSECGAYRILSPSGAIYIGWQPSQWCTR